MHFGGSVWGPESPFYYPFYIAPIVQYLCEFMSSVQTLMKGGGGVDPSKMYYNFDYLAQQINCYRTHLGPMVLSSFSNVLFNSIRPNLSKGELL